MNTDIRKHLIEFLKRISAGHLGEHATLVVEEENEKWVPLSALISAGRGRTQKLHTQPTADEQEDAEPLFERMEFDEDDAQTFEEEKERKKTSHTQNIAFTFKDEDNKDHDSYRAGLGHLST